MRQIKAKTVHRLTQGSSALNRGSKVGVKIDADVGFMFSKTGEFTYFSPQNSSFL